MQFAPTGGQIWNWCKWRHLVDNFVTYASGAIRWQTFQLAQVVSSGGQKAFQGNVTMQVTWNVTQWPNFEPICNTLPEAQRTQGIDFITWVNLSARIVQIYFSGTTWIGCKFGHQMLPLELVLNLVTRWRHLHSFQILSPDGATCISSKFGHQMAPLALVQHLVTRWCHLH